MNVTKQSQRCGVGAWVVLLLATTWTSGRGEELAEGSAALRWTLQTRNSTLTLGISADQSLCLCELCGPDGWNWVGAGSPLPLLDRIDVGGTAVTPQWTYRSAASDRSDGQRVTITFSNAKPAMELLSIWQAHDGPGPVRHTMFITNKSDQPVTIYEQESLAVRLVSPAGEAHVWYISNDAGVPDETGVYRDALVAGYRKELRIAEGQNFIPYTVVDAEGRRGVYIGWEWSIGRIAIACDTSGTGSRSRIS